MLIIPGFCTMQTTTATHSHTHTHTHGPVAKFIQLYLVWTWWSDQSVKTFTRAFYFFSSLKKRVLHLLNLLCFHTRIQQISGAMSSDSQYELLLDTTTWPQTSCCPFSMKSHVKGSNCIKWSRYTTLKIINKLQIKVSAHFVFFPVCEYPTVFVFVFHSKIKLLKAYFFLFKNPNQKCLHLNVRFG